MVHWPGDPSITIDRVKDLSRGDDCTLSHLDMGAHTGTHVDAPSHYLRRAPTLDRFPLDAAVGRARVLQVRNPKAVTVEELRGYRIRRDERLLFKTRNSARCWKGDAFVKDFVFIEVAAAQFLAARSVRLVGIDYLSVGGFFGGGKETHEVLLGAGIWIVEGLDLSRARPLARAPRPGRLRLPPAPPRGGRRRSGARDPPRAPEVKPGLRLDSDLPPG